MRLPLPGLLRAVCARTNGAGLSDSGAAQRRPPLRYRFPVGSLSPAAADRPTAAALDLRTHILEVWRTAASRSARSPTFRSSRTSPATFRSSSRMQNAKGAFARAIAARRIERDFAGNASRASLPTPPSSASIGAVCYSACDTVRWNETIWGPAALNRALDAVNDVRDAAAMSGSRAGGWPERVGCPRRRTRTKLPMSTANKAPTPPPPSPAQAPQVQA